MWLGVMIKFMSSLNLPHPRSQCRAYINKTNKPSEDMNQHLLAFLSQSKLIISRSYWRFFYESNNLRAKIHLKWVKNT